VPGRTKAFELERFDEALDRTAMSTMQLVLGSDRQRRKGGMTPDLGGKDLLEILLGSESKGELLMLFHKNPGIVDTVEGVARRIGRGKDEIEGDIKDFTEIGLLRVVNVGKLALLSFDKQKDAEIQASMTQFIMGIRK
jgi:hypothetical protein